MTMDTLESLHSSLQPVSKKPAPGRRTGLDPALAEHYHSRVRRELGREAAAEGPIFRLPAEALRPVESRDVWDVVADRLLDVLAWEDEQPLPFDAAAGRHERATLRLVRCEGDAPLP